jgi:2-hydroxy-6-oxonona-2,4-dienedioate hydrolase
VRAKFTSCNGYRTRYLEEGEGPPVVLLHGIGHSADLFYRNIDALAERHRVIAPDLPGHGFSDRIPLRGRGPQPVIVEHLWALLKELSDEPYSLIGSSYGGLIASLMTLSRPNNLNKLIIVGSGGTFQEAAEQKAALLRILDNAGNAMNSPSLQSCRARLANICADPSSVAEEILLTQLTAYGLDDRFEAFKEILSGYILSLDSQEDRALSRLELISVPTLLITGRNDIRATVESHERGSQRIPKARLVIFENCGHLPYMEHPQKFNHEALTFLAS